MKNYVYFIKNEKNGLIKIGQSKHPRKRVRQVARDVDGDLRILATIEDHTPLELELHQKFHDCREHGEWFRPEPELLAYIVANKGRPDLDGPLQRIIKASRHQRTLLVRSWDETVYNSEDRMWSIIGWLFAFIIFGGAGVAALAFATSNIYRFALTLQFSRLAAGLTLLVLGISLACSMPLALWATLTHYEDESDANALH